jgi:hypothetical protein
VYVEAIGIGVIFKERKFSENCWTHDLEKLLNLADLKPMMDSDAKVNAALAANWAVVKEWKETSRYEQKSQNEAQGLFDAIVNDPDGVLSWIRRRW